MVEMDHMILQKLGGRHQVADQFGVFRDLDVQGIFDGAYRCKPMHQGADAADPLGKGPGIPRITATQNNFDPPHLRSRADRLHHILVRINFDLDAQMSFNAGDRIDDDTLAHGVAAGLAIRLSATSSSRLPTVLFQPAALPP